MKFKLYHKLFILFLPAMILPFLISGMINVFYIQKLQSDNVLRLNKEIGQFVATEIGKFLHEQFEILRSISNVYQESSADKKFQDIILDRFLYKTNGFIDLTMVNSEGKEIVRKNVFQVIAKNDLIDRKNNKEFIIVQKDNIYISSLIIKEGKPFFVLGKAILDVNGSFQGAVFVQIDGRIMQDTIRKVLKEKKIHNAYIVDEKGVLIAHPDISQVLAEKNFSYIPLVSAIIQNKNAAESLLIGEYQNEKKKAVIGTVIPMRFHLPNVFLFGKEIVSSAETKIKWWIITEQLASEAFSEFYKIIRLAALVLIGGLVVLIIVVLLFAKHIINPIEKLHYASLQLGKGNFNYRVALNRNDELKDLADSFNEMSEELKLSEEKLKKSTWENIKKLEDKINASEEEIYELKKARDNLENKLKKFL